MKEIKYNFKLVNLTTIIFIALSILLIIFVDSQRMIDIENDHIFQIWYLDTAFGWNSGQEKGPGMVLSMILNIIAGILFIPIIISLYKHRIRKNYHYLSQNLYISALYLGIGRWIEAFYIITETNLRGLLFVVGRFFIPLDNFAMILFFGICADVFFSTEIEKNENLTNYFSKLTWITYLLSWSAILVYFTYNDLLSSIFNIVLQVVIGIIFAISLLIEWKILKLTKKLDEKQRAVKRIGQMLLAFVIVSGCSLFLITTFPDLTQYLIRSFKNLLLIIIALLYNPAFIKTSK